MGNTLTDHYAPNSEDRLFARFLQDQQDPAPTLNPCYPGPSTKRRILLQLQGLANLLVLRSTPSLNQRSGGHEGLRHLSAVKEVFLFLFCAAVQHCAESSTCSATHVGSIAFP